MSALLLSAALACPAAAVAAANAITAEQVAAAITNAGMTTSADRVALLTNVVASTSAPALKVDSLEQWGDRGIKVRLSCVKPEECLPFFVAVRGSQAQAASPTPVGRSSPATLPAKSDSTVFTVRAGARETLLLDGGHVHIQISVVCLESGEIGQTIRVASLDRQHTYTAQVGSDKILRGSL
jgi:hypothetical protein